MEYTVNINGSSCAIKLSGKISFFDHIEFKKIFEMFHDDKVKNFEIDLEGVEFVDSAGLGIMLMIRDEATKNSTNLTILKPRGQVQKMFKVSRFYEIFKIID